MIFVIECEPGKGRVNQKYVGRNFRLSSSYREFKQACELAVPHRERRKLLRMTERRPLEVTIHSYWPRKQGPKRNTPGEAHGDVDACVKATLDGFTGLVWDDDDQIIACRAVKHYDPDHPRVEVHVEEFLA